MDTNSTSKVGRPSSFQPEYAEQAYKLCLLGATDADLADFFEVSETTVNNWKLAVPEFVESIKRGKRIADAEVAFSLYDKATSGDTTACIFWLKNRKSQEWRDKQEHEVNGTIKSILVPERIATERSQTDLTPDFGN